MADAKVGESDIDEVIRVGGATRIPAVEALVRRLITTAWCARKCRQEILSSESSDVPRNHRLRRVHVYSEDRP